MNPSVSHGAQGGENFFFAAGFFHEAVGAKWGRQQRERPLESKLEWLDGKNKLVKENAAASNEPINFRERENDYGNFRNRVCFTFSLDKNSDALMLLGSVAFKCCDHLAGLANTGPTMLRYVALRCCDRLAGALKHKTYLEQQTLKISVQLGKFFSKYLFSKAKITRFEKTRFVLTVTEILRIKLQYLKIQILVKKKIRTF